MFGGLCACGRRTCARKTHDGALVEAKQQVIRGKQPRTAKMQSELIGVFDTDIFTTPSPGSPRVHSADGTSAEDYDSEPENDSVAPVAERDTRLNRFGRI